MKIIKENPPFLNHPPKKARCKSKKVRNILDRCLYNSKKDTGFFTYMKVPFENNQA